jgi:hypothetical protein
VLVAVFVADVRERRDAGAIALDEIGLLLLGLVAERGRDVDGDQAAADRLDVREIGRRPVELHEHVVADLGLDVIDRVRRDDHGAGPPGERALAGVGAVLPRVGALRHQRELAHGRGVAVDRDDLVDLEPRAVGGVERIAVARPRQLTDLRLVGCAGTSLRNSAGA